ncbi:MAG: glycosyltransferase [Cyanobacteria bacterium P01_F01_bin.150]
MFIFCLFGLHRLWLIWTYVRIKLRDSQKSPNSYQNTYQNSKVYLPIHHHHSDKGKEQISSSWCYGLSLQDYPIITVQLPIYNEKYVVERLINAVCSLDYPIECLEIQVLDDSTDETVEQVDQIVQHRQSEGFNIAAVRRPTRQGFKAGALQYGLEQCQGEFILIFDADFIPPPNLLRQGMPCFSNSLAGEKTGMVQFPWGHVNREYSLLTYAQSVLLDGHFHIEHLVRSRTGRFFNFNGTAGIWRKQCILDAGGWQGDTLTEDMDLSYRAQLKGWVFQYVPDVHVPAELPIELNAFKSQQYRWAKGGVQTAIKLLPILLREPLPLKVKLESIFHLTSNLTYVLIPCLLLLLPALILCMDCIPTIIYAFSFITSVFSVMLFYVIAQLPNTTSDLGEGPTRYPIDLTSRVWKKTWQIIVGIPILMAVGAGLCVNNSKAVLEAIFRCQSGFVRTPKYNILAKADKLRDRTSYRVGNNIYFCFELFLLVYLISVAAISWTHHAYHVMPFVLIFMSGFLYFTVLTIRQSGFRF